MAGTIPAPFNGKPYVFISYSHNDSATVVSYIKKLESMGYRIWYDEDIPYTTHYDDVIANAIANCSLFTVFFTRSSVDSQYVLDEVHTALNKNKTMHPVFLEDVELPEGTAMRLGRTHQLWRSKFENEYDFFEALRQPMENCRAPEPVKAITVKDFAPQFAPRVAHKSVHFTQRHIIFGIVLIAAIVCVGIWVANRNNNIESINSDGISTFSRLTGLDSVSVGDHFTFGGYPQNESNAEPIEWRVLKVEDGKAMAISVNLLDIRRYDDNSNNWEGSELRLWLNDVFLHEAFNDEEIQILNEMDDDKVTLLTVGEANVYFRDTSKQQYGNKTYPDLMSKPTVYAKKKGAYVDGELGTGWWWLKSPGGSGEKAADVDTNGLIGGNGTCKVTDKGCVRPVITVSVSD